MTDVSATGEPLTFPSGDLILEGLFHRPRAVPYPAAVVCHPHPLYGGDMHNYVVTALCQALAESGIAALRFNYRGVGGSEGKFGDGVGERADAAAALAHLRHLAEVAPGKVGIIGYSFGAAVALVAADRDVAAVDQDKMGIIGYSFGAMIALAAADERVAAVAAISPPSLGQGVRDLAVRCPTLLISGEQDEFAPPASLSALATTIGPHCQMSVVRGADHFWCGYEKELAQVVAQFFRECLIG